MIDAEEFTKALRDQKISDKEIRNGLSYLLIFKSSPYDYFFEEIKKYRPELFKKIVEDSANNLICLFRMLRKNQILVSFKAEC